MGFCPGQLVEIWWGRAARSKTTVLGSDDFYQKDTTEEYAGIQLLIFTQN
jgi:hypothetical protein